jgi:hypothetical protein
MMTLYIDFPRYVHQDLHLVCLLFTWMLGIVDDLKLLGNISDGIIIYFDLKDVFKQLFGTDLNLQKSSLLSLQLNTVVDPPATLEPLYLQLLELREIPVATKGTVIVGVPIGTNEYTRKLLYTVRRNFKQLYGFHLKIIIKLCFFFVIDAIRS